MGRGQFKSEQELIETVSSGTIIRWGLGSKFNSRTLEVISSSPMADVYALRILTSAEWIFAAAKLLTSTDGRSSTKFGGPLLYEESVDEFLNDIVASVRIIEAHLQYQDELKRKQLQKIKQRMEEVAENQGKLTASELRQLLHVELKKLPKKRAKEITEWEGIPLSSFDIETILSGV